MKRIFLGIAVTMPLLLFIAGGILFYFKDSQDVQEDVIIPLPQEQELEQHLEEARNTDKVLPIHHPSANLKENFVGVGVHFWIQRPHNIPVIGHIYENSPAEIIGLQKGDVIVKIGEDYTSGMTVSQVSKLLQGEEGSTVVLGVYRDPDYKEYIVTRDIVSGQTNLAVEDSRFLEHDEGGENLGGNYRKYKNAIYYWDLGPHAVPTMTRLDLDPDSVSVKSKFYIKDNQNVYASSPYSMEDVDAETFEDLEYGYGKDENRVFFRDEIVTGADVDTFESLSHNEWRSRPEGYYIRNEGVNFYDERMEWLMGFYGKDKEGVFFNTCRIDEADPSSFIPLDFGYGKDDKNVFYRCNRIKVVDLESFHVVDRGMQITGADFVRDAFGKDKNSIFLGDQKVSDLDIDTFEIVTSKFVKDKKNVFMYSFDEDKQLEKVEEIDADTFISLNDRYTKDKNSVYCHGEKLENADPDTFRIDDNAIARDKNFTYNGCNIIE